MSNISITTVGAGICGLTTALSLQQRFPNAEHKIVAETFANETLSAGAAGIFRPGNGLRNWIRTSYNYYDDLLRSPINYGIMQIGGYIFSSLNEQAVKNPLLEPILPTYRPCTPDEVSSICPGNGFRYGSYFETMVIECSRFLPVAMEIYKSNGGVIATENVTDLNSLPGYVFNCTGLSSGRLCNDDSVIPIRGQVLKVRAPWVKMCYYGDVDTYIIPSSSTITLGGTRNFDSQNLTVDTYDSMGIFERCKKLVPSLARAEVVREWVGLRPYRGKGVRVGVDERNGKLFHNYGHGGYGITSGPGTAAMVVGVFEGGLRMSKL